MAKIVLSLLLLFIFAGVSHQCNIVFTPKHTLHFINEIPNSQITLRCRSKEDDLGFHTLKTHDDYHFKFCQQFFGRTLYACDVKWADKKASFHGFDIELGQEWCVEYVCKWTMMPDGIYFTVKKNRLVKRYNWTTNPHEVRFNLNRKFSLSKLEN